VNFLKASTDSGFLCRRAILIMQSVRSVLFVESNTVLMKRFHTQRQKENFREGPLAPVHIKIVAKCRCRLGNGPAPIAILTDSSFTRFRAVIAEDYCVFMWQTRPFRLRSDRNRRQIGRSLCDNGRRLPHGIVLRSEGAVIRERMFDLINSAVEALEFWLWSFRGGGLQTQF